MIRISPEIWKQIQNSNPQGHNLNARPALPELTPKLFCALDSEGQRHLLIPLANSEKGITDRQTRGLYVVTRNLHIQNNTIQDLFIDIVCRDSAGFAAFDIIGGDIAIKLSESRTESAEIVKGVLGKWRRFWSLIPLDALSREEILGLFAELWFLSRWLIPKIGCGDSLFNWRGPFGARHDFEWPGCSIEVKATTSKKGRIFHINGIEQLEPPEKGSLFFFGLLLREEGGAQLNLPSLISEIRNQISDDYKMMNIFDIALVEAGYSPIHDTYYENFHFRIYEEALFSVIDNFPRIVRSNIDEYYVGGIECVNYIINLSGLNDLILANKSIDKSWINLKISGLSKRNFQ